MINEFRKTLTKVIHLRSIIGFNGLVFALKKTPVIGKLLPDRLYNTKFLKVIFWIFHIIVEVFKLFIGKIFGLGMIYLLSLALKTAYMEYEQAAGVSGQNLFASFALFFFLIYALCGIVLRRPMFKCTPEKEYLVFMLRMNARKLDNTLFIFDLAKLVIGYLIAGIIAAICGAPIWLWLGIPVLAVFIKLFGTGLQAFSFRMKNKRHKPMKSSFVGWIICLTLIIFAAPFVLIIVANGYYVPLSVLLMVSALLIVLGVLGFMELNRYDSNLHRRALNDNIVRNEVSMYKSPDTTKSFKKIKAGGTVKGDKKGFEYLNALFVKRHFGMLYFKPIVFTVIIFVIMGLAIFAFVYGYYSRFGAENCLNMVGRNLLNLILFGHYEDALMPFEEDSGFAFFRWIAQYQLLAMFFPISIIDNSFKSTQAMYINCDNSLMTFSFFKQREKIIKLFDIRLKQLIKVNAAPAVACGLSADLILFYTGGQDYPFQYLVTILICVLMSAFYATIWLTLYYLFQPFTTTVNVKSGAYRAAWFILGFVFMIIIWIPSHSLILAGIMLVLTVLFVFIMRKLVYKFAPKTWKVKT